MEIERFVIRARLTDLSMGSEHVRLFGFEGDDVAEHLTRIKHEPGTSYPAFAEIHKNQAQVLMDDLWSCGLRPSEGSGSAGSLAATENHLADMRKIVFKKLDIDQVKK